MAVITIQVLDGIERGRVYSDLVAPLTIGREVDNSIQLNDERVSRFHVKIQEDGGRFILTDLDSTNGTKINGHPVQMRVLQPGDQVSIGRSVLLIGSESDIRNSIEAGLSENTQRGRSGETPSANQRTLSELPEPFDDDLVSGGVSHPPEDSDERAVQFPGGPPPVPAGLRIAQAAQLSDLLAYVHDQLVVVSEAAIEDRRSYDGEMRCSRAAWQRLLRLQMQLAKYMRQITEP